MPDSYTTRRPAVIDGDIAAWTTNTGVRVELEVSHRFADDRDHVVVERADGYSTTLWYHGADGRLHELGLPVGGSACFPGHAYDTDPAHALSELRRGVPASVLKRRLSN